MIREVYRGELETLLKDGATLVDVREAEELAREMPLPGHKHVPLSRLGELAKEISRERPTIFYCRSGMRSYQAAEIATTWTEQPVYYLSGGLLGYASA